MIKAYLKQVFEVAKRGDATEVSFYSALAEMLQNYAKANDKNRIHITTPPKQTEAGNPDFRVEKVRYEKRDCRADHARNDSRVYINKGQYFAGIPKEIWEYQVGGYQVCDKWLKGRKERALLLEDIKHYCAIVTALQKTIGIQKKIDVLYPEIEK